MHLGKLDSTQLPMVSIRLMLAMLETNGFAANDALKSAKLSRDRLRQPNGLVTAREEFEFQRAFVALTRLHPQAHQLWLDLGVQYHCVSFGSLGAACLTAAKIEDAFKLATENQELHYGANTLELLYEGTSVVGIELVDQGIPDDLKVFTILRGANCTIAGLNHLCGGKYAAEHVELGTDVSEKTLVEMPFTYGAQRTAIYWSKETARQTIHTADDALHRLYLDDCRYMKSDDDLSTIITRSLLSRAITGHPVQVSIDALASEFGFNRRTFQRRLAEEETSPRELMRVAQLKAAEHLLRSSRLSLDEIASRMGYTETCAFSRAFRRWSGASPGSYRRQLADA